MTTSRIFRSRKGWIPAAALVWALLAGAARADLTLTTVRIGGGFTRPIHATAPVGDTTRVFVLEQQSGHILIIENGVKLPTPFLDIGSKIDVSAPHLGMLGMAFDPDYDSNGQFYVTYSRSPDRATLLERYKVSAGDPNVADPLSGVVLLGPVAQDTDIHKGGHLAFGADGMLYVALGDTGKAGALHQPLPRAQEPDNLHGKILRLDVDLPAPHVPPDNPYVGNPGVLDEIWAFGMRNPWRWSIDSATGDFYIADVGGDLREEIDFIPVGAGSKSNWGFPCMEGIECTGFAGCTCNEPTLDLPIHEYDHLAGNCAVVGGYVYRGSVMPGLRGTYFFADFCSGRLWSFRYDGLQTFPPAEYTDRTLELAPLDGASLDLPSSFGEDGRGEILICDFDGDVYMIVPDDSEGVTFCSGKTTSQGCVPFLSISGSGLPSVSDTRPFHVRGNDFSVGFAGVMIYGFTKHDLAFHGGKLCVKSPQRTAGKAAKSRIAVACTTVSSTGRLTQDFNARIQSGTDPFLTIGQKVFAQWQQRDSVNTSGGFPDNLSNGILFTILP